LISEPTPAAKQVAGASFDLHERLGSRHLKQYAFQHHLLRWEPHWQFWCIITVRCRTKSMRLQPCFSISVIESVTAKGQDDADARLKITKERAFHD
jgi:hypothetical protein